MNAARFAMGFLGALAWAIGCGGNVVVDGGSGGSGGAPPTTSPGTQTSSGTMQTTSTTTGDPQGICATFCQEISQFDCGVGTVPECIQECLALYDNAPQCQAQIDAFLLCFAPQTVDCVLPDACLDEFTAFDQCINGGCEGGDCFVADDGSCGCTAFCEGQERQSDCKPAQDVPLICSCFINGMEVGTCEGLSQDSCDVNFGCCAGFW